MNNTLFIYFLLLPFFAAGQKMILENHNPDTITISVQREGKMFSEVITLAPNKKAAVKMDLFYKYVVVCNPYTDTILFLWEPNHTHHFHFWPPEIVEP